MDCLYCNPNFFNTWRYLYIKFKKKMAEKKSLVEEALIQMKSLEETVAENAKGILHSTMKEEIGQLVKESLGTKKNQKETEESTMKHSFDEQEEDEVEVDTDDSEEEMDMDSDEEEMDMDSDEDEMDSDEEDMDSDEEEMDMDSDEEEMDMDFDMEDEEEPIDLTNASDEEILKVFKGMSEEDGIIVKKDGNTIDLKDGEEEYKISLGEQEDEESYETEGQMYEDEVGDPDFQELDFSSDELGDTEEDELVFEIEFDEEDSESDEMYMGEQEELDPEDVEFGDIPEEDEELDFGTDIGMDEDYNEGEMPVEEGFKPKVFGGKTGKPSFKYSSKPNQDLPTKKMKQGTKGVGMGKPKFEYKEGENLNGKTKIVKKTETKEASRTLGAGRKFGRKGLPKPKAAPRHLNVESVESELSALRAKNEEYRKALNIFREKLNEVAIFNSNLAYATRLFTEHSTTKHEKINILRRFDGVETLKESKSLYKTIKDELSSQSNTKVVKESLQEKFEKTPVSGSAASLIESKTYENPQFMRMKDLMSKMNIINIK